MFKTLIKKVREESNNPSILPENNSDEINGYLIKENTNSNDEENSLSTRTHRKSFEIYYVVFCNVILKDDLIQVQ
jgi:hypothetical protein